ncbi:ribonuclease III [Candidatus Jorgensenbacteria bacterium CG10_big_fil_rev_8_21_14_0_10_54_38]|uniref:Ribonuclease 3 n=2 Tax=Candidatus Joergenseniibacteriota TaxID=1752739 RepID=A0A2M6WGK7_9BACT|nr:MAG: ribonuclease III [Candidatus Jorgensenbacteria bacterium CG23_combo_of_CG06-09_8_20_14_all_54_14]PIT91940.1 MAG: ribonuclease III [Candidatus Jorgensenbacteria bacterium CG10_big_fil_rev_8_21_14_0_10_54_38]
MASLGDLEEKIGVAFKKEALLKEALTHRSYLNEHPRWSARDNERLEYLGDAVLELAVTEFLFRTYPNEEEGKLTSIRAALVNYQMLARVARDLSLERYLYLSRGEAKDVGRAREVILANAVEAVLGAVYLDRGYETAKRVVARIVLTHIDEVMERKLYRDPKSVLQEVVQEELKTTPSYRVLREEGPDHDKLFVVGVFFGERQVADGEGPSKQEAEARAAQAALESLSCKGKYH